eukprot:9054524-Lingulodinium_polyedra.AAC.1
MSHLETNCVKYLDELTQLRRYQAEWDAEWDDGQWDEPVGPDPGPESFHIGTDAEDGAARGDGDDEGFTM